VSKKTKKTELWKKSIKPIKILKKPIGSIWFRFYKLKTEKTKPNKKKGKKTEQTELNRKNWAKPEKTEPNQKNRAKMIWIGFCPKKPNRNRSVWTRFDFFLIFRFGYFFFIKTKPNWKCHPYLTYILIKSNIYTIYLFNSKC